MSSEKSDAVRDAAIAANPDHEGFIRARDQIVEKWCQEHGTTKDELTIPQILEIRELPEWKNA